MDAQSLCSKLLHVPTPFLSFLGQFRNVLEPYRLRELQSGLEHLVQHGLELEDDLILVVG